MQIKLNIITHNDVQTIAPKEPDDSWDDLADAFNANDHDINWQWRANCALEALHQLDACCDGAATQDGIGFAGMHTRTGKWLAGAIASGYKIKPHNVDWLRNTLPYYMNTQLSYIPRDAMEDSLRYLDYIASINQAIAFCEITIKKVNANRFMQLDDTATVAAYKRFPVTEVKAGDMPFCLSLMTAAINGRVKGKQFYWMRKMMQKYVSIMPEGVI